MNLNRVINRLRKNFRGWVAAHAEGSRINFQFEQLRQSQITSDYLMSIVHLQHQSSNPLSAYAKKIFSQTDEDGITLEICKRIGLQRSTCIEIGCGSGVENNTLALVAHGWKAIWFDSAPLAFDANINPKHLYHAQRFVTRENIMELVTVATSVSNEEVELISVDIDGNDGYLVEEFLKNKLLPSIFIVEINEVFPPPIRFKQDYLVDHVWDHSRNYGWSLQAYIDLFDEYGYRLVACNPQTGVNAFFVRADHVHHFSDVPTEIDQLYVGRSIHPFKYRDQKLSFNAATISHMIRGID